jgi:hypothetical protein
VELGGGHFFKRGAPRARSAVPVNEVPTGELGLFAFALAAELGLRIGGRTVSIFTPGAAASCIEICALVRLRAA